MLSFDPASMQLAEPPRVPKKCAFLHLLITFCATTYDTFAITVFHLFSSYLRQYLRNDDTKKNTETAVRFFGFSAMDRSRSYRGGTGYPYILSLFQNGSWPMILVSRTRPFEGLTWMAAGQLWEYLYLQNKFPFVLQGSGKCEKCERSDLFCTIVSTTARLFLIRKAVCIVHMPVM